MDTSVVKNIFVLFITQLGTWLTQIIHAWEGHGCTTKELPNGSKHHEKNTVWYIYIYDAMFGSIVSTSNPDPFQRFELGKTPQ
jgi:hypothetical protein